MAETSGEPGALLCTGLSDPLGEHAYAILSIPTLNEQLVVPVIGANGDLYVQVPLLSIDALGWYTGPCMVEVMQGGTTLGSFDLDIAPLSSPGPELPGSHILPYLSAAKDALLAKGNSKFIQRAATALDDTISLIQLAQAANIAIGTYTSSDGTEMPLELSPDQLASFDRFLVNMETSLPAGVDPAYACLDSYSDMMLCVGTAAGIVAAATVSAPVLTAAVVMLYGSMAMTLLEAEIASGIFNDGIPSSITAMKDKIGGLLIKFHGSIKFAATIIGQKAAKITLAAKQIVSQSTSCGGYSPCFGEDVCLPCAGMMTCRSADEKICITCSNGDGSTYEAAKEIGSTCCKLYSTNTCVMNPSPSVCNTEWICFPEETCVEDSPGYFGLCCQVINGKNCCHEFNGSTTCN